MRWRPKWWHILLAIPVLLLLIAMVAWLLLIWQELRARERVDARATALGVPLTWETWDRPLASPEDLERWRRLQVDVASIRTWASARPDKTQPMRIGPGFIVPEEMRAHHATLDADAVGRILEACDHFGGRRVAFGVGPSPNDRSLTTYSKLGAFLAERAALASSEAAADEIRRLLGLVEMQFPTESISEAIRGGCLRHALRVAALRMPDVREAADIPERMEQIVDSDGAMLADTCIAWFIASRRYTDREWADLWGGSEWHRWLWAPLNRAAVLDALLDAVVMARQDFRSRLEEARRPVPRPTWLDVRRWLAHNATTTVSFISHHQAEKRMHALVVVAEMRREPWPVDAYAPDGARLRRLERDGRLIGAYSVGRDGVDDGGKDKVDLLFPLYDSVDPPAAAAPVAASPSVPF